MSDAEIDPEDEELIGGDEELIEGDEEEEDEAALGRLEEREQRQHSQQQHGDEFAVD